MIDSQTDRHLGSTLSLYLLLGLMICITLLSLSGCQSESDDESKTAEFHTLRGNSYFAQGDYGAGIIEARNALAKDPQYPAAVALLGNIFLEAGDARLAIEQYEMAVALDPTHTEYAMKLAESLIEGKQFNTALLNLSELKEENPDVTQKPTYFMLKGYALLSTDRTIEAKQAFNHALQLEANHARTLIGLAQASYKEGNIAKTEAFTQQAEIAHPQDVHVLLWGAQFSMAEENYLNAEKYLTRALLQMSNHDIMTSKKYYALNGMIRTLIAQGKTVDALQYSEILENSPQGKLLADYKSAFSAMQRGETDEAEATFDSILSRLPGNPAAETAMGVIKYSQGDLASAENHLLAAVQNNDALSRAHKLLALTQLRLDKPNDVIKLVGTALKKNPKDPELLSLMGISYLKMNDAIEARNYLNQALKFDPKHASSRLALANIYEQEQQHKRAIKIYRAVIDDFPTLSIAYKSLLNAYAATSTREAALKQFTQATKAYQKHPTPHLLTAIAHLDLQQYDNALDVAKKANKQFPDNQQVKGVLGVVHFAQGRALLKNGQFDAARQALKRSKTYAPNNLTLSVLQIETELRDNQLVEGLKLALALQQSHPDDSAGFNAAGNILQKLGKHKESLSAYERAWTLKQSAQLGLQLFELKRSTGIDNEESIKHIENWYINNPEHPPAQMAAAMAWQTLGLNDKAIIAYEKLITEQPKNALVLNNLAWLRFLKGELTQASQLAKRAYQAAPENPSIIDSYGWILLKRNQIEDSLQLLRKAHTLAPNQIEIMQHLAEALTLSNRHEEAKQLQREINKLKAARGS